eukprot:SAG31_NODE_674_length_12909_cov_25.961124_5_plen_76_part_00
MAVVALEAISAVAQENGVPFSSAVVRGTLRSGDVAHFAAFLAGEDGENCGQQRVIRASRSRTGSQTIDGVQLTAN